MVKKLQRGAIYKADGQLILVKPENGKAFTLKELQTAVGGYIQAVRPLDKRSNLYVDEEGLLKNLPPNKHTKTIVDTKHYGDNFMYPGGITLWGDAISTYRVDPGEESDLERMLITDAVKEKESA